MKNKNFIIIVLGQIISLFGNAIQRFSMSLYLLKLTGSTVAFSNILAISTLPYIIFAPLAGKLSDSVCKKKIMIYLDLFCAAIIGGYAFILIKGFDNIYIAGIIMFILSVCYTLYGPAVTCSIPKIVKEENLIAANGVINQVGSVVNFLAPILAGVLYGLVGIKIIVIINAVSFFISAIMELFLKIPENKNKKIEKSNFIKNSFIDMKDSLSYLRKENKIILYIIVSYAFCNIFLVPILSIAAPYFINIILGLSSNIYGIVEAVCVLGMILGGFIISKWPCKFSIKKLHYTYIPMVIGMLLMCFLGFSNINRFFLGGIFSFGGMLIMLSLALSNVLTLTYIQKQVPEEMMGRVSAFSTAVATISVVPGQFIYGQVLNTNLSIGLIFFISALLNFVLFGFVFYIGKSCRD